MIKPKKISSLIKRVLDADPEAGINLCIHDSSLGRRLHVNFKSILAYSELKEEIDLPIVIATIVSSGLSYKATIEWDCSDIRHEGEKEIKPFAFDDRDSALESRRCVNRQEEETAALIGGKRHVGSGAIEGLKSDASSGIWQAESKSTKSKSFSLTLEILDKIFREARIQDKKPLVHIRFLDIPENKIVSSDWIVVLADDFERLRKINES